MNEQYQRDELAAIYELGRIYYEMGYFAAAERVFSGLSSSSSISAPALLGQALIRIEHKQYDDALNLLRALIQEGTLALEAKIAMCACLVAMGDFSRGKSLVVQVGRDLERDGRELTNFRRLWEALAIRCDAT